MATMAKVVPINRSAGCAECRIARDCLGAAVDGFSVAGSGRVVHRGDHVVRGGERFRALYVVRSGAVKSYTIDAAGDEHVIAFHLPGDLLGIDGIDTERHVTNAVALDTSSVCVLPFDRLCEAAARTPALQRRLLAKMSRRVRDDEARVLILGQKSADQRIATFILALAERRAGLGCAPDEVNLPMPRADIASYLALAVETVSRVLTRLQDARILRVQRNRIDILDAAALAAAAQTPAETAALARAR